MMMLMANDNGVETTVMMMRVLLDAIDVYRYRSHSQASKKNSHVSASVT